MSFITLKKAKSLKMHIYETCQDAIQADGISQLVIKGEVHETFTRNKVELSFDALVCENLNGTDILGGMNFLYDNSVIPDARKQTISVGKMVFPETNPLNVSKALSLCSDSPVMKDSINDIIEMVRSSETSNKVANISVDSETVLMPGCTVSFKLPPHLPHGHPYVIQPMVNRVQAVPGIPPDPTVWPAPRTLMANKDKLEIINDTDLPIYLNPSQNIAIARPLLSAPSGNITNSKKIETLVEIMKEKSNPEEYLAKISVDPHNIHSQQEKDKVWNILRKYHTVFDGDISEGYNNASGPSIADFNFQEDNPLMENKGYFPRYSHAEEMILQGICDYYEDMGILQDPQALNIPIKHVSPLLLVRKPHTMEKDNSELTIKDYRMVGAFNALNDIIKAIPIQRPEPEHVHRFASKCKYLFKTDADTYFYQLWADQSKWPYLVVQTPLKGKRILTRAVMGVKGMSECADAHMAKVLQELIIDEKVAQDHDDVVTGAELFEDSLKNFEALLEACYLNNVKLSPHKTVCLPERVDITGWEWSNNGSVSPSSHQIIKLKNVVQDNIITVKNMRSFVGLYKVFFKAHPSQASVLTKLEKACAGADSKTKIKWTPELSETFIKAKKDIENIRPRWLPKPTDQLVITQDAALKDKAIGLILWAIRDNQWHFVECYSTIISGSLENWFPCELEGFSIGTSGKKFKHYISRSNQETVFLSDSSSCILAWKKMKSGKMSASSRLCLFLSSISTLPIRLEHSSGKLGQIIGSDTISRNASSCTNPQACQMCKFINEKVHETPVNIKKLSVDDILQGKVTVPFLSPAAIKEMQQECSSCVKAIEYIKNGVVPQANNRKITDAKRYVRDCKVDKDGLLYAERTAPDLKIKKVPVIPKHLGKSVIFAQHIALNHCKKSQMKVFIDRNMYLLQASKVLKEALKSCHLCLAADNLIKEPPIFTSETIPNHPGSHLVADVMKHSKENILVAVDDATGYVLTCKVKSEQAPDLAQGLAHLLLPFRLGPQAIVRVDRARGLAKAQTSPLLAKFGIKLDLGDAKNKNSCAIVDKAIQELEMELKRLNPEGSRLSDVSLLIGTHYLNSKLRPSRNNLSSKELLLLRDQYTGEQLNISDKNVINRQHEKRVRGHKTSIRQASYDTTFQVGDLVLLKGEGSKHQARDSYIVCGLGPSTRPNTLKIRKMLHILGEPTTGKIMKQVYLVKPSQLIKYLSACTDLSSSEDSSSSSDFFQSSDEEETFKPSVQLKHQQLSRNEFSSSEDEIILAKKVSKPGNENPIPLSPINNDVIGAVADDMEEHTESTFRNEIIDASLPDSRHILSDLSDTSISFGHLLESQESDLEEHNFPVREQPTSTRETTPELDWDNYASSPSFSKSKSTAATSSSPPAKEAYSSSSPPPTLSRWARSRRPVKKTWGCNSCPASAHEIDETSEQEETFDDLNKDPDYKPTKKKKLKRQIPLNKCKKPNFKKHEAWSSSDDEDSQPPPVPPRSRRSVSVLVISKSSKPAL